MTQINKTKPAILKQQARQALKQWHDHGNAKSSLADLLLFRKMQREKPGHPRQITNQLLQKALEMLETTDSQQARLLRIRFLDRQTITYLANQLNVAESTTYVLQRKAVDGLTSAIRMLEEAARAEQQELWEQRLNALNYTQLVEVKRHLENLTQLLTKPGPPWIISLQGIGGIGKSTLADALVRTLFKLDVYEDFAWVSARQAMLNLGGSIQLINRPALTSEALVEHLVLQLIPDFPNLSTLPNKKALEVLRTRLKQSAHLIVVDNLETLVDVQDLLPTLQRLADPSRFLLTSRERFYEPNLYHFSVPELSEPGALQLIRQEAQLSNLPILASSCDADLHPIYTAVGGNPLAIRLVVGQTHLASLPTILADLTEARGLPAENLFNYIYRRSWDCLDDLARYALLAMPLANPRGDDLEGIAEVSDLAIGDLRTALNKLLTLNLVDSHGGLYERRYTIHSMTRTFLLGQVAKWQ